MTIPREWARALCDSGYLSAADYAALCAIGFTEPPSAVFRSFPQRATGEPEQSDSPLSIPSSCGGVEGHALSVSKVVTTPSGALSPHGQVPLAKAAGVESGPQDSIITIPPSDRGSQ